MNKKWLDGIKSSTKALEGAFAKCMLQAVKIKIFMRK